MEGQLRGTVRLLFQPAEEGWGGAKVMIEEGALDGVSAVFGLHVLPFIPTGVVQLRAGPTFAGSDRFNVTIHGVGGHAAAPHTTKDPVLAASMAVVALQPLLSRETDPLQGGVVTVSRFNTGPGASNIIPQSVNLVGTIRAFDPATFVHLRQRVADVFSGTATLYGCDASIEWSPVPYPPLVTSQRATELAMTAAAKVVGPGNAQELPQPFMFAEDFAFLAGRVPAAFAMLGIRNETVGSVHGLHSPQSRTSEVRSQQQDHLSMAEPQAKQEKEPVHLLETSESAELHRKQRGDPEPTSPGKSGLGRHIDVGGVGDFGPVDTERMQQKDERNIEHRVP
ncbi:IAA-amino acid hydrolase ILR1-like 3 [Chlorella sorokiniana]|uniref:IAA-amino acid hydrolase ILR1-like 3 n=1 Tax=Chlorella sorokiniana TaxID=3076 RepID=A0A2P6TDR5_CHLSO|nr:IAA-amino acid hydrolase ILR1-like 3 [Chlorella sorokiniana]|eukprot:PRW20779.1 IAA-amino acid hydrolase ILR1-like 3 [Chlorella sorokiniana]